MGCGDSNRGCGSDRGGDSYSTSNENGEFGKTRCSALFYYTLSVVEKTASEIRPSGGACYPACCTVVSMWEAVSESKIMTQLIYVLL